MKFPRRDQKAIDMKYAKEVANPLSLQQLTLLCLTDNKGLN